MTAHKPDQLNTGPAGGTSVSPVTQAAPQPGRYELDTSRICLNLLGSPRARRETYTGAWLPEPLPDPAEWPGGRPAAAADHDAGVALLALVIKAVAIRVKREDLAGVNPMAPSD